MSYEFRYIKRRQGDGKETCRPHDKKKDPLWAKAVSVVEGEIVKRAMILPEGWHVQSNEPTSLCQKCMIWGGFQEQRRRDYGVAAELC